MTDDPAGGRGTEGVRDVALGRRRFLQAAGTGAAGLAGLGGIASARIDGGTVIELEAVSQAEGPGRSEYVIGEDGGTAFGPPAAVCNALGGNHAWQGVGPADVAGQVNPALELTAGEEYTIEWTNADGDAQDLVVVDDDGEELVSTGEAGGTVAMRAVTFEATREMAAYYYSTHPGSQYGAVDVGADRSIDVDCIAADPTDVPEPIDRSEPTTVEVELEATEVVAELEPGVTYTYMTFDDQVPGPMIRVRQGETVEVTLANDADSVLPHNVDLHGVRGPGGGASASTVGPGETETFRFEATYPGAFIYHCAVPNLDYHISSGMFGLILVEPPERLPEVDHEFYFGQNELYTTGDVGEEGHHDFDFEAMKAEDPTYVLMNGENYA